MTFDELSREQKTEAKQDYLTNLAMKGRFVATIYGESSGQEERDPSWGELANADKLVSDETMEKLSAGVEFVTEDFSSRVDRPLPAFSPDFVESWCDANITPSQYEKDHDKLHTNYDIRMALKYAADKIKGLCARYRSGRLSDDDIACMYRQEEEDDDMH